jgi:hypothetical protein
MYNFAKRGMPKRMSVIMRQDSVTSSKYAQDYINTTWIQRHNHTFYFINILHRYIDKNNHPNHRHISNKDNKFY